VTPVEQLLRDDVRLPSPPAIAVRILTLVKQDKSSFRELANIIQADPALTGRILRVANSAMYAPAKKIGNIETAVAVLGENVLKNLALSFIVAQTFERQKGERFDIARLWRRSITAAVAGQLLSSAIGFKSDDIFITTLLQDIGIGAMFMCRRNEYLAVLDEKAVSGRQVTTIERQIFDFDHQEVGSTLLRMWGLPESVYEPIRYHHDVESAPLEMRQLCEVIRASDRLAAVYCGTSSVRNVHRAKELLLKTFDLDEDRAIRLIDEVAQKCGDLLSQFSIETERIPSYSEILEKANEELNRLNLSCQALVIEFKETQQKAESLATELKAANEKLRTAAFRDELTGLYNHRYFQEALTNELASVERYKHPASIAMFDVDNFKTINDNYGHRRGDAVLQAIGGYLQRTTRASDVAARYGGDEFVILLRETNLEGARVRADLICSDLRDLAIDIEGFKFEITVSVGIAGLQPGSPMTKELLIDLADQAMYLSKKAGRNRVSHRDNV
jgi:diguanylate cyclase (GGDEF)-like protein